jgi:diaminopimelate decarboxylase
MSDKKTWSKPSIVLHEAGRLNKYNAIRDEFCQSDIDGVSLLPLLKKYQSPLFIISEKRLRENIKNLIGTFSKFWPDVKHAWPYKTNYLSAVCAILHSEGSLAEVVSEFEYLKAQKLGMQGSDIILNGPYKPLSLIKKAIKDNAVINIDHFDELHAIEQAAKQLHKDVKVGIRLNFNTGFTEHWGRFGFNVENGEAMNAAMKIQASKHLRLTRLHSHIGTFVLDVRAYAAQARIMSEFLHQVEHTTGCFIESLNMGGGFASHNALKGIYLPPDQIVPSIEQYAIAITQNLQSVLADRIAKNKPVPRLYLETGRAVIDDAECLVTSVVGNKILPDGRRASILDAGVNLMFTSFWYNHEVKPLRPLQGVPEETVLLGPLCMNLDVIRSSILLPPLNIGEPLMITHAGAYNNTQWMQFIETRPAIIMIMEDGHVELVRDAEKLETLNGMEHLPLSLQDDLSK